MGNRTLGWLDLFDFEGCDRAVLNDAVALEALVVRAAREAGATIVNATFHRFNPIGISGVVVIAESHVAIHTWPEHGCASVDVFSCSAKLRLEVLEQVLALGLRAGRTERNTHTRGVKG
jgi:S-adenosylmethionine decarboxylase proenzyme